LKYALAAIAAATFAAPALAQTILYSGGTYSQNFDGLPTAGSVTLTGRGPHALNGQLGTTNLDGWYGANFSGSSTNTEFRAHDGSLAGSAGRGVVSFGTNLATERALGALPTSNQISSFGALFVNNTASTLDQVTISFTGEQWRRGDVATANVLTFGYALAPAIPQVTTPFPALNFTSPNMQASPTEVSLDGNLPLNSTAILGTITGLTWAPGSTLAISWGINDISGQDNGLGIDSFTLSAVPAPGSAALLLLALATAGRRRR
jgi:large repetitive protein